MTTTEKTYTDKQSAFLEALLSEARGDICTAMSIAGYESPQSCDWHLRSLDDFSLADSENASKTCQ